jgi:protein-tyrosine-phosphatase
MAEAFGRKYGLNASSAGTLPSSRVNEMVVQAMKEKGIDISRSAPKALTRAMIDRATLVVTMGCSIEEACPRPVLARMQKRLVDWELEDPKGKTLDQIRAIRDRIELLVQELAKAD